MQNVCLGNVYLTFFAMINVQDMLDRFLFTLTANKSQ